jgi:hypothetical protein
LLKRIENDVKKALGMPFNDEPAAAAPVVPAEQKKAAAASATEKK